MRRQLERRAADSAQFIDRSLDILPSERHVWQLSSVLREAAPAAVSRPADAGLLAAGRARGLGPRLRGPPGLGQPLHQQAPPGAGRVVPVQL
eukprot:scaffold17575_cov63-Phaeocystis_antarctica.AAC.5